MNESRAAVFSHDNRAQTPVYPHDVFTRTDEGSVQIRGGGTELPPEALEVLVMLDGKRNVGDLEQKLPNLTPEVVRDVLRALLAARFVRAITMAESGELGVDFGAFFAAAAAVHQPSAGAQASASREAASGVPRLERDGYYVSIARKAVKARAGAKPRALIVEDDTDMSALVKRLLERAGFEVAIAASRAEVSDKLRAGATDIVVLDVTLPDLNGFDLLQKLKAHPALKEIPVVMLTADSAPESIVRGLASGADGYVTKPFDHPTLVRGVKAVLGA
jgi:two-component system OmpR family response regulator